MGVLEKAKAKLDDELKDRQIENQTENTSVREMEPNTIDQIKCFIEKNYTDPQINLASVAQNFGFSASYLSRKFKQEVGKNISQNAV